MSNSDQRLIIDKENIVFKVQENSSLTLITDEINISESSISFILEKNSKLIYIYDQLYSKNNFSLDVTVVLEQDAKLEAYFLLSEPDVIKINFESNLLDQGANSIFKALCFLNKNKNYQINTKQIHKSKSSFSDCVVKSVLFDSSNFNYDGTIVIKEHANYSVANQQNKNLLFSQNSRALSIPNLEVLTNDVKCAHGSAVGSFDYEQLFYLMSRGLTLKEAQKELLSSFLSDVYPGFFYKNIQEFILEKLETNLNL